MSSINKMRKTRFLFFIFVVLFSIGLSSCSSTGSEAELPILSVLISWDPPTLDENGDPLTGLSGYLVYYGSIPGDLDRTLNVGDTTNCSLEIDFVHDWYFAVRAYDPSGNISPFSIVVSLLLATGG